MDDFLRLPRLYAIADIGVLRGRGIELWEFGEGLRAAGVRLVQLRDKGGSPQEVLGAAGVLREVFGGIRDTSHDKRDETALIMGHPILIMNDRADLALLAGFEGVHMGQGDLSVGDAKTVGSGLMVGISTHTEEQVRAADASGADYIAIGPVFATGTKVDAAAVVGLDGVRRARAVTAKPLVAIGGITRENGRSVIDAGANAVAVISGLLVEGEAVDVVARDFLRILG